MSDETKNYLWCFLAGIFAGVLLTGYIANIPESGPQKMSAKRAKCEQSLPRNQFCRPVFIPEKR